MVFLLICTSALNHALAQSPPPIGQWREHVPFANIIQVDEKKGSILAVSPYGYFFYDPIKNEFERKTKINGLSDLNIDLLIKDPNSDRFSIVYNNTNIDFVDGDLIKNIPDILLKKTLSDKKINNGTWIGKEIFFSSNLGIIVLNTEKKEIKDTYRLGLNGSDERVYQVALLNNYLFAATASGLKKVPFQVEKLSDHKAWVTEVGQSLLAGECSAVLVWNQKLIVQKQDSIFINNTGGWQLLHASILPITGINVSGGKLFISQSINQQGQVIVFSNETSPYQIIKSSQLKIPVAIKAQGDLIWVADRINGLIRISGNNFSTIKPDSPDGIATGAGIYLNGNIWASAGSIGTDWKPKLNENGFFKFDGGSWKNYNKNSFGALDSIKDVIALAGDVVSGTMYAGSFGGGLIELTTNSFKIFKQNSLISSSLANPGSFRVSGLAFDDNQHLWISNYGAEQNLVVRKKDGTWKKFTIPFPHTEKAVGKIMIDLFSRKWIISPKGNGLFCFDDGGTIDQVSDDKWRFYRQGKGNGNLPSSNVLSVIADRNGFIWVGTDRGIGIIECGDNIFRSGDCDAILPIVQQDNYAGLLFGEESINDIAVDGADRKWIATNNGVWLVSSDGQKLISRFTETNSALLGNKIYQIVIHKLTGEVFFFTNNGICSFRGTATEPTIEKQKPMVFPNPVPPGYSGSIAIKNLPENSWIKITELDGRLVYQGRSLGGQATWNGKNYKGEKVSSNVYLVFILDQYNTQQLSTKIFFIK